MLNKFIAFGKNLVFYLAIFVAVAGVASLTQRLLWHTILMTVFAAACGAGVVVFNHLENSKK